MQSEKSTNGEVGDSEDDGCGQGVISVRFCVVYGRHRGRSRTDEGAVEIASWPSSFISYLRLTLHRRSLVLCDRLCDRAADRGRPVESVAIFRYYF